MHKCTPGRPAYNNGTELVASMYV